MVTQKSKVLEKMRNGQIAICTKINLMDSRVVEIAAIEGFDCVWPDMEHVPNSISAIEKMVLAAKAYDTDILVRVPRGSYSDYIYPLEADATGIMVPHVMGLDDARKVVQMTKYKPIGRRPFDGGNADGAFERIGIDEYLWNANVNRFVCLQIEDPESLNELDEIAELPGVDMLFFGPGDFSYAMDEPLHFDHPEVLRARKLVVNAAKRYGKFAGTVSAWPVEDIIMEGYNFISMGADVIALREYFKQTIGKLRCAIGNACDPRGKKDRADESC